MLMGLDFDSCCVKNEWPEVGEEIENCVPVLWRLIDNGHEFVLITMRVDELLEAAKAWFVERHIPIKYVNRNPEYETGSRKVYVNLLFDDKSLGIPLITGQHRKPFVDWYGVERILEDRKLI
jgi:hypothetical protein